MRKIYYLSLILVLLILFAAGYITGGRVSIFLDPASGLVVVITTFCLVLANFTLSEIGDAFRAGFSQNPSRPQLEKGYVLFHAMQNYLWVSAAVGTLTGTTAMLANLEDSKAIGMGAALAMLCVLYAMVLNLILVFPFKTGIRKRLAESD